jgi:hypothetical protein
MNYHRGFAPIMLIVIIALALGGGYAYTQTQHIAENPSSTDTTAGTAANVPDGWTTYTSAQYGFSISFPESFTARVSEPGTYCDQDRNCFSARAVSKNSIYDLTQFDLSQSVYSTDYKVVTVNGNEAITGTACDGMCEAMNYTFKVINGQPVTITFFGNGNLYSPKTGKLSALASQIISTFSSQSLNGSVEGITGWTTYTNSQYGFSFKYPNEFYTVREHTYRDGPEDGELIFSVEIRTKEYVNPESPSTSVSVHRSSSLDDFVNGLVEDMTGDKLAVTKREKVSDDPLLYRLYVGNSNTYHYGVAIKGDMYFYISAIGRGPSAEQILSTFKFTK